MGSHSSRLTGPIQVLARIVAAWGLTSEECAALLDYTHAGEAENLLNGRLTLRGRDREERVRQIFAIHAVLKALFQNPETEPLWLRAASPDLSGLSPLAFMIERGLLGMVIVRNVVDRIAGR